MNKSSRIWLIAVVVASGAAAAAGGCGDSGPSGGFDNPGGTDGGSQSSNPALGGFGDGGTSTGQGLVVTPAAPVLDVTVGGPAVTQQFTAAINGTNVAASWMLDDATIGTIDGNGLFTAGTRGGQAGITAQYAGKSGMASVTVRLHVTENPGNVDPATQTKLKAGGGGDGAFAWLYPYDQTVFPRGLLPPSLQFAGNAPDATYVHITAKGIDYEGFFGASNPGKVAIPAATWKTITTSAGGVGDPVTVAVSKISGGAVAGPITETWTIAPGNLKGTVYYNTYSSPLNNGSGAVMRIKPGANAEILSGGCTVCHAVSANGNVLVTLGGASYFNDEKAYANGMKVDLVSNQTTPRADPVYGFGGVYPDGSLMLSNAALPGEWPPNVPGIGELGIPNTGARPSQLIDLSTGSSVNATGLAGNMLMPSFSPDGKKVAFNHYDAGAGHSLAVLDFDAASHTFSNLVDVVTDQTSFLGWPAFLPDTKSFLFHGVSGGDYATWRNNVGDLFTVDLATKTRLALDAVNGVRAGNQYIPYGAGDLHLNYEPTVLPIAVGGYYWVVFTSRRQYGNTITGGDPWGNTARKKLWVAAIDMPKGGEFPQAPTGDPSHPPFYLEGQEEAAGNMRGFWALDPCKQNGNSCESGDECCNGFCRQLSGDGGSQLVCVPPPAGCANEFEKCTVDADCCGNGAGGTTCIAGHCAKPVLK